MLRLEIFNEWTLLMWTYFLFLLSDFLPSPLFRYYIGFVLVALIFGNFMVNILYLYAGLRKWPLLFLKKEAKKKAYKYGAKLLKRLEKRRKKAEQKKKEQ
jgi:hypothetical protein